MMSNSVNWFNYRINILRSLIYVILWRNYDVIVVSFLLIYLILLFSENSTFAF